MNQREIFTAALAISDPVGRDAFLDAACPDPRAKEAVLALIEAEAGLGRFLETPAIAAPPPELAEGPGTLIGPYKLMEQIGEGGMGLVFVAEQREPVRRKVALKIIKPGMDSRDVIARFEAERQALALMDHPNIAKVLDAGTTKTGLPYFVMELVKGIPIVEYCDRQQLTARERLELFLPVCRAVQHAHGKGIIHRDLKPSNILVAPHDGAPVVKVIDFGIAKAIGQQLTDRTIYTRFAQMIGTPLYMSPEQAEINALDVDTRSDIYSLGVLLYELLTGTTPFDSKRFATAAYDEIRRIIKEEEPPKPSTRLSTMGESLSKVSNRRKTEPAQLSALLKGDLDWIVMKALEKDRNRRYDTASALAADVRRFLAVEPIEARPPSTLYRFRKMARRNKAVLVTAGLVAAALVLGTVASTWQAVRASVAEREARSSEGLAQQRKREADDAKTQAESQRNDLAKLNADLRRAGYIADMNLARVAWDEDNLDRTRELLDKHRPKPGEIDLRGFEWHYLRRLFLGSVTVKAYDGYLYSLSFMPDGKHLLTSGQASEGLPTEVKLWDLATNRQLPFRVKEMSVTAHRLILSPDGSRLAATLQDRSIRIWDLKSGDLTTLEGPAQQTAWDVSFSPDGGRVVSTYSPERMDPSWELRDSIRIWDVAKRTAVVTIDRLPIGTRKPSFSPDGKYMACALRIPGVVKVWDATTGAEAYSCAYRGGSARQAVFSPDGKHLAAYGERGIQMWDAVTHVPLPPLPTSLNVVMVLAFSPDGGRLAVGSFDGVVEIWDVSSGRKLQAFKGHAGSVGSVAFSSDGTRLVTGGSDGTFRVWDATGLQNAISFPDVNRELQWIQLSPDGRTVIVGSQRAPLVAVKSLQFWDAATGEPRTGPIEFKQNLIVHDWAGDGRRLYAVDLGGDVTVLDASSGEAIHSFRVDVQGQLANSGPSLIHALSPDERWFAHLDPAGRIAVLDAKTGVNFRTLDGPGGRIRDMNFSEDGSRLLAVARDGALKIWDVASGRTTATARVPDFYVFGIRFSPDGKRVALYGNAARLVIGEIKILDAESGREVATLKGHVNNVIEAVFSPDGRRLATSSIDRSLRIWDVEAAQEIMRMECLSGYFNCLRFVSNGHRLLSTSTDKTVRVWDATPLPPE